MDVVAALAVTAFLIVCAGIACAIVSGVMGAIALVRRIRARA